MCGVTHADIGEHKVQLFVGYSESYLKIDDTLITDQTVQENKDVCKDIIGKIFTKKEMIDMLIQFIENGTEG